MVLQQSFQSPILCRQLRNHASTRPTVNGWLLLDDSNFTDNTVYLVSRYRDEGVAFTHDKPYHDYLRACHRASIHAELHDELPFKPVTELVVQPLHPSAA